MADETHEDRVVASVDADKANGHEPVVFMIPRRCRTCRNLWRDYCERCRLCPDCTKGKACTREAI